MKGDESKVRTFCGELQVSFHVGKDVAAVRKKAGSSTSLWVSAIGTDFGDVLLETMAKSS